MLEGVYEIGVQLDEDKLRKKKEKFLGTFAELRATEMAVRVAKRIKEAEEKRKEEKRKKKDELLLRR